MTNHQEVPALLAGKFTTFAAPYKLHTGHVNPHFLDCQYRLPNGRVVNAQINADPPVEGQTHVRVRRFDWQAMAFDTFLVPVDAVQA